MKFLASELNNNKELFYLLLDVKEADAKAKCLDVYSKFKIVKNKYMEFINNYFSFKQEKDVKVEEKDSVSNNDDEEASLSELEVLLDSVLSKKAIKTLYQPVIDLKTESVWAYEVFTKIESNKRVDILRFFEYSKDVKKHDKLQQVLLINGIEDFESLTVKEADKIIVNVDLYSYDRYINKPRIYDMMKRNKVIIEFQNYERKDFNKLQEMKSGKINVTDNMDFVKSVLSMLEFDFYKELDRVRYVYVKNKVTFEIDEYIKPKMKVVGIEGNKEEVDKVYKVLEDKFNQ